MINFRYNGFSSLNIVDVMHEIFDEMSMQILNQPQLHSTYLPERERRVELLERCNQLKQRVDAEEFFIPENRPEILQAVESVCPIAKTMLALDDARIEICKGNRVFDFDKSILNDLEHIPLPYRKMISGIFNRAVFGLEKVNQVLEDVENVRIYSSTITFPECKAKIKETQLQLQKSYIYDYDLMLHKLHDELHVGFVYQVEAKFPYINPTCPLSAGISCALIFSLF